jgi:hypothetical protein
MKYIKIKVSTGAEHTVRLDSIRYVRQTHNNQVRLMMSSDYHSNDELVIQVNESGSGDSELYSLKDSFVKEFVRIMSGKSTISDLNLKQADGTPYTISVVSIA